MADQVFLFASFCRLVYLSNFFFLFFQFVVVKVRIEEIKGRKAIVSGRIEDLKGTVLVEASSTFVQPRYAKLLHSADLRKLMGEPPSTSSSSPGSSVPVLPQDLKRTP